VYLKKQAVFEGTYSYTIFLYCMQYCSHVLVF